MPKPPNDEGSDVDPVVVVRGSLTEMWEDTAEEAIAALGELRSFVADVAGLDFPAVEWEERVEALRRRAQLLLNGDSERL